MAYDKVVDSAVLDAGLKQIADAIREKGGKSDTLAFPAAMAEAIAAIEAGGGGDITIHNRKVEFGSFVPASDRMSYQISFDFSKFGSLPSGCMFWAVSDVIANTAKESYVLGCCIGDFFGRYDFTKATWGYSMVAVESSAASTSATPTMYGQRGTPSGGSVFQPWAGTSMAQTAMSAANEYGVVTIGGTAAYFVAGMEYQYILFGGLEE